MFNTQILAGSSGQGGGTAQQSLRFDDGETQYLSWTPAAAGNRKTWTWSGWVKRGNLGLKRLFTAGTSGSSYLQIRFDTNDEILCSSEQPSTVLYLKTTQKFRDTSAWYHLVVVMDTTQSTAADRTKLYVNGSLVTDFSSTTRPSQNTDLLINSSTTHMIGALSYGATSGPYDGYLSDVHFIDGQALDAASFGETVNGYWKAKDYAGTYGQNGFRLTFQDDVVSEGFNTVTYSGRGAVQSVSGLGFSPAMVWTKERDGTSYHEIHDIVRGANKQIFPNATDAEESTTKLTSFDGDGFSLAAHNSINESGKTYVGWCWEAGGTPTADNSAGAGATPTSNSVKIDGSNLGSALGGSIAATRISANTARGFSIVTYTGTGSAGTIAHGLGAAPKWVIVKCRSNAIHSPAWPVWHTSIAGTEYLDLQTTAAKATAASVWNSAVPTSSVFSVGTTSSCNNNNYTYVAYCWAEISGYSKFGSYSGNGSSTGPTVTTGFRPAFLLIKRTDAADNWHIADNTRSTDGTFNDVLRANLANAESANNTAFNITYNDTGFTLANTNSELNASGGTYIYMAFADTREAAFWKDVSGQGNHWTPNNLDYRDSLPDSPANNFCTNNSIAPDTTGTENHSFSDGNLKVSTSANSWWNTFGTIGISSGKYYWEYYALGSGTVDQNIGLCTFDWSRGGTNGGADSADSYSLYAHSSGTAYLYTDGSSSNLGSGYHWTWGDVMSVAFDAGTGKIWYAKNGTFLGSGNPAAGSNEVHTVTSGDLAKGMLPVFSGYHTGGTPVMNFGQDSTFSGAKPMGAFTDDSELGNFQHQPPAGFKSLCTANLPTSTIVDGSEYFNTVLYTGNAGTQSITGVGFDPDFVWAKNRVSGSYHPDLYDSVRGDNLRINSSQNVAEATGYLQFISDGFSLTAGGGINANGNAHVAWNWKAGGTAVSNTDGSITSQVSANVDAGFSISTYTEPSGSFSFGHGLNVTPEMFVFKRRDGAENWIVWHKDFGTPTNNGLYLNSTSAQFASGANWLTGIDSDTISITSGQVSSAGTKVCYAFHSVDGYSKVGSYTGNGNNDGAFVYTGFRPAWTMIKRTNTTDNWVIDDAVRSPFNEMNNTLYANLSNSEYTAGLYGIDFLSNGFKIRDNDGNYNGSGSTYIYLAFAETPQKFANAR